MEGAAAAPPPVASFVELTGCDAATAQFFMEAYGEHGGLEAALAAFFEQQQQQDGPAPTTAAADDDDDDAADAPRGGGAALMAEALRPAAPPPRHRGVPRAHDRGQAQSGGLPRARALFFLQRERRGISLVSFVYYIQV